MSAPSAEARSIVREILEAVDPQVKPGLEAALHQPGPTALPEPGQTVVLAGHRTAGKTRLLPLVGRLLGRPGVDLDAVLERTAGRPLKEWVAEHPTDFRAAERRALLEQPPGSLVAVGGGFLSHHPDALAGCFTVVVPITFATYRERLLADTTRPRLRPQVSLEEEISSLFHEREALHARVPTVALVDFLRAFAREGARRVVTLPPTLSGGEAVKFAQEVRGRGAELLEVRTDLHAADAVDAPALASVLPLLVSERGKALPPAWVAAATWVDRDVRDGSLEAPAGKLLASHHADRPLSTAEALARWDVTLPRDALVKHVEPLGEPSRFPELLATQEALRARFGPERVTVLAMGALALPFRAVLAERNALDYVAAGGAWSAAPGQRLLDDAAREARARQASPASGERVLRRGILGTSIAHSRSPEVHRQPFDRIDLPEDAPVEGLVDALRPYYAGFAVTSPFKLRLAKHTGSPLDAINTLVRRGERWESFNTDIDGARTTLEALKAREVLVLGDGGTTAALRAAAEGLGCTLRVLKRDEINGALSGAIVWTWPERVTPPESLRFEGARVAVIAYGAPGQRIAAEIERRGGTALPLGEAWFDAQAQRQRTLWESAT